MSSREARSSLVPPPSADPPRRSSKAPAPGTVLPPHYARCFGCGDQHETGLHLSATVGEGVSVDAVFRVTEDHQGAPGLAHGGVLATAADEALGFLLWVLRRPAVTGKLEVDYLRPVPVGSDLHLRAECLGVDGRKIYARAEGRLNAPDGPPALRASALFIRVELEHFTSHAAAAGESAGNEEGSYNP